MGEQAETHTPVGASHAIRITQGLQGYEGTITGRMLDGSAGTLAEQEAALLAMKATPGRTYMLTTQRLNIPVVIGNVVPAPAMKPEPERLVSFDFWATTPGFKAVL
jgi:hypothetical protein